MPKSTHVAKYTGYANGKLVYADKREGVKKAIDTEVARQLKVKETNAAEKARITGKKAETTKEK